MKTKIILTVFAILVSLTNFAYAHGGRRFSVVFDGNQLAAQGYLSEGIADDTGGFGRPYLNAIHDHFGTESLGRYNSTLPGFDVFDDTAERLAGADLMIELRGATKWVDPANNPDPVLVPLSDGEVIGIGFGNQDSIDTDFATEIGGSFELISEINDDAILTDLDLNYSIASDPANTIYALEWVLSTDKEGIEDSESVYTILLPAGPELHQNALTLERSLGITATAVPEPSSLLILAIAGSLGLMKRRKR